MSDPEDAPGESSDSTAVTRIGNGEREAAIEALRVHHVEGRLNSREYEDRSMEARQARTWPDLNALFLDLPEPRPVAGAVPPVRSAPRPSVPPPAAATRLSGRAQPPSSVQRPHTGMVPEPLAGWVMSLTPFAALGAFFITHHWQWFLAIPIVGIIVYGPDGKHRDRGRNH